MLPLIARRLLHALAVVLLATTASFALLHLAPGDPVRAMLDAPSIEESVRAAWRVRLGLDRPLGEQYVRWLAAALRGDLGWSVTQQRPVLAVLRDALPHSLLLVSAGLALALGAGVALGAAQAWRPRSRLARALGVVTVAIGAMPEFVVGLLLLSTFALRWMLFPAGGVADPVTDALASPAERIVDRAWHLVLPAAALALAWTAIVARHQRGALRDVAREDFVRTARAKGLGERRVLLRHALRASLAPTLTLVGLALPALVGGAVITEAVFGWPGLGLVATRAVAGRDYALVSGVVVAASAAAALGSLVADLLVAAADPRVTTG